MDYFKACPENWLKETKDPITTINETIQTTSEVIKRLPEFEIMDKANQALTYLVWTNSTKLKFLYGFKYKMEMISFRNQSIIGLLILVIFIYWYFNLNDE